METKVCKICEEEKSLSEFYKKVWVGDNGYKRDGHDHRCKSCHGEIHRHVRKLNKGFENLKPSYCECCGQEDIKTMMDHDHETGNFRGFICKSCNRNIALFGDTFDSVMKYDCDQMYKDYMKMANYRQGKDTKLASI